MEAAIEKTDTEFKVKILGSFTFRDKREMFLITKQMEIANAPQAVVFDLSGCDFIDSAALGMLILAAKTARTRKASFAITGAVGVVRELLMITKLV
jgi:anti-anti-sigma factor